MSDEQKSNTALMLAIWIITLFLLIPIGNHLLAMILSAVSSKSLMMFLSVVLFITIFSVGYFFIFNRWMLLKNKHQKKAKITKGEFLEEFINSLVFYEASRAFIFGFSVWFE